MLRDLDGRWILDDVPRGEHGRIDIDVYWHDTVTGVRFMTPSEFGNLDRDYCLMPETFEDELHWVFNEYWWCDGSMGCNCNRPGDYECVDGEPTKVVIEQITLRGRPDIVLYAERPGTWPGHRDRRLPLDEVVPLYTSDAPL